MEGFVESRSRLFKNCYYWLFLFLIHVVRNKVADVSGVDGVEFIVK